MISSNHSICDVASVTQSVVDAPRPARQTANSANHSITRLMLAAGLVAGLTFIGLPPVSAERTADVISGKVSHQAPGVVAKVSKTSVQVAEAFSLTLTVSAPSGSRVTFPATVGKLDDFDVIDTQDSFDIPDATALEERTWTRRLTLESIVTGERIISPLEFQVRSDKGLQVLRSEPIAVRVTSVLEERADPTQFRDIQSVIDVAVPTKTSNAWLWWTVGGSVGLACFAAMGLALSRRNRWVSPKEWAMQELDELESSIDYHTVGDETTALPLSKIVRDYLLMQFAIPESGLTPQEIVRWIESNHSVDGQAIAKLNELFGLADKAKFAGFQISPAGLKSAISDSRDLVQRIARDYETDTQRISNKENN
jgi:hypothetical protein